MTVEATVSEQTFEGNGSAGPFTFNFRFFSNSDIEAYLIDGEVETLLVEGTNYTLSGAGSALGGSITLMTALAIGTQLYVVRNVDIRQLTSIRNLGAFFPEIHENVFDRLMMAIQDRERRLKVIETRGYTINIQQAAAGVASITEADTSLGPVVVNLPGAGTVKVVKAGDDANQVTFQTTVPGQTIADYSLTGDGEYIELTLLGTTWRKTG